MIPKQELMALAAELQLQAHVAEKDYALGWFWPASRPTRSSARAGCSRAVPA